MLCIHAGSQMFQICWFRRHRFQHIEVMAMKLTPPKQLIGGIILTSMISRFWERCWKNQQLQKQIFVVFFWFIFFCCILIRAIFIILQNGDWKKTAVFEGQFHFHYFKIFKTPFFFIIFFFFTFSVFFVCFFFVCK